MGYVTFGAERAASFASTAALYEFGRPGYPPQLIAQLFAEIGVDAPRILDLGAGTGKLTRQLVEYGSVVAVEPLAEMREQFEHAVAGVLCVAGGAESIPLPDSSVDVVMVGQAFHWFDQEAANPEIWRVLADDGSLVALWNDEDPGEPWIVALTEIMSRNEAERRPSDESRWWINRFRNEPWFTKPVERHGTMNVVTTKRGLLARMESHSYLSVRTPEARQPVLDEVAALIESFPDPFDVRYNTEAYWCRKLPLSAS